jgi:hypothetical protein
MSEDGEPVVTERNVECFYQENSKSGGNVTFEHFLLTVFWFSKNDSTNMFNSLT